MSENVNVEIKKRIDLGDQAAQSYDWAKAREYYQQVFDFVPRHGVASERLDDVDRKEKVDRAIIEKEKEADALFAQRKYAAAGESYLRALEMGSYSQYFRYQFSIEEKHTLAKNLNMHTTRVEEIFTQAQTLQASNQYQQAMSLIEKAEKSLPSEDGFMPLRQKIEAEKEKIMRGLKQDQLCQTIREYSRIFDFEGVLEVASLLNKTATQPDDIHGMILSARRYGQQVEDIIQQVNQCMADEDWSSAFTKLDGGLHKFETNPVLERNYMRVGMMHGNKEMQACLSDFQNRQFEKAQQNGTAAARAFEKVLARYSTHEDAKFRLEQSQNLRIMATGLKQAEIDWKAGRRREAAEVLTKLLSGSSQETQSGQVVTSVIQSMKAAIEVEIKTIEQQAIALKNGERYVREKNLQDAYNQFYELQTALLPEVRSAATRQLTEVEKLIGKFKDKLREGQSASELEKAIQYYNEAIAIWPNGPDGVEKLIPALLKSARRCWEGGKIPQMLEYVNQVLELEPDNQEANDLKLRSDVKERAEAELTNSQQKLDELRGHWWDAQAAVFQTFSARLQDWSIQTEKLPEVQVKFKNMLQAVEQLKAGWDKFSLEQQKAWTAQRAGRWHDAVKELRSAVEGLGDAAPLALQEKLKQWQEIADIVGRAQNEMQTALQQARGDYQSLTRQDDARIVMDSLEPGMKAVQTVQQALNKLEISQLPAELDELRQDLLQIQARAELVLDALSRSTPRQGRLKIEAVMQQDLSDGVLKAIQARLQQREQVAADDHLARARQAEIEGRLGDALDDYRLAGAMRPDDETIEKAKNALERRQKLEEKLLFIDREVDNKTGAERHTTARDVLQNGMRWLVGVEDVSPNVRAIMKKLMSDSDLNEGLAFEDDEQWKLAQDKILELDTLATNWADRRAYELTDKWAEHARTAALLGMVASTQQLGDFLIAYRKQSVLIKQESFNFEYIKKLGDIGNQVMSTANSLANDRLEQARVDLNAGLFQSVIDDLKVFEDKFYGAIAREFPNLLNDDKKINQTNCSEARKLLADAERLQMDYQAIRPVIMEAQSLYAANEVENAEKKLQQITIGLKSLPTLKKLYDELDEKIQSAKKEIARDDFERVFTPCESQMSTARDEGALSKLLESLNQLKRQKFFKLLDLGDVDRLDALIRAVDAKREGIAKGVEDENAARRFLAQTPPDYVAAEKAFSSALQVAPDIQKKRRLQDELERISQEVKQQRKQAEDLERGAEALKRGLRELQAGQYRVARTELINAQECGVAVDKALLLIARIGVELDEIPENFNQAAEKDKIEDCLRRIESIKDKPEAEAVLDLARSRKMAIERKAKIIDNLSRAQSLLTSGDVKKAREFAREVIDLDAGHVEGQELLRKIDKTDVAIGMIANAQSLYENGKLQAALEKIAQILAPNFLPGYAEAESLKKQILHEQVWLKVAEQIKQAIDDSRFDDATSVLTQVPEKDADPVEYGKIKGQINTALEKWRENAISRIQNEYGQMRYEKAYAQCEQAIRIALSEVLQDFTNLRDKIINEWLQSEMDDISTRLGVWDKDSQFDAAIGRLARFDDKSSYIPARLKEQAEGLRSKIVQRQLESEFESVQKESQSQPQSALNNAKKIQKRAEQKGLTDLSVKVQEWVMEIEARDSHQKSEKLKEDFQRCLAEARKLLEQFQSEPDLMDAKSQIEKALAVEGFQEDREGVLLQQKVAAGIELFQQTQKAIQKIRALIFARKFQVASQEFSLVQVSGPLEPEYRKWEEVVQLLMEGEDCMERKEYYDALKKYAEAIQREGRLEAVLSLDLQKCRKQVIEAKHSSITAALRQAPPDLQAASDLLNSILGDRLLEPARNDIEPLKKMVNVQKLTLTAREILLQKEDLAQSQIQLALGMLKAARDEFPVGKVVPLLDELDQLAELMHAWFKGLVPDTRRGLNKLSPLLKNEPRIVELEKQVCEEERIRGIVDQSAPKIYLAIESEDFAGAIDLMRAANILQSRHPLVTKIVTQIATALESKFQQSSAQKHYLKALEWNRLLGKLSPRDEKISNRDEELTQNQAQLLKDLRKQIETAISTCNVPGAQEVLDHARQVAGPEIKDFDPFQPEIDTLQAKIEKADRDLEEIERCLAGWKYTEAVQLLSAVLEQLPAYRPAGERAEKIFGILAEQVKNCLSQKKFKQARENFNLMNEVAQHSSKASSKNWGQTLDGVRKQIEDQCKILIDDLRNCIFSWDLRSARDLLGQIHELDSAHPDLAVFERELRGMESNASSLNQKMHLGWEQIARREYGKAKDIFQEVLTLAGQVSAQFPEVKIWGEYAKGLDKPFFQGSNDDSYAASLETLRACRKWMNIQAGSRLPSIFGSPEELKKLRRQAAWHVEQLLPGAEKMVRLDLELGSGDPYAHRDASIEEKQARLDTLKELLDEYKRLTQLYRSTSTPPDNFSIMVEARQAS